MSKNHNKNKNTTAGLYPWKVNRKPIKDIVGDKSSLGILLMDAEVLDKCRLLSGESEVYEHEYAVWYSTHDIYTNIGKQTFTVSRPYSFYNINQVTGGASVEYEASDRQMLNDIDKELREQYQDTLINSKEVVEYNNRVVESIKKYYALSYYDNDVSEFTARALVELHVTDALIEEQTPTTTAKVTQQIDEELAELTVGTPEYLDLEKFYSEEATFMIEDEAFNMAVNTLTENGYTPDPEITEEDIQNASISLAVLELEDKGFIIMGKLGDMTEEEQKDVIDNNKLVIGWYLSNFHTFHAHPTGVNSFSGTIGGQSGDLMNKYEESFNRTTGEWEQTENSETGIVYQFVADENTNPIPSFSGVVQQRARATTLIFNELRMWKCVKDGDYTYSRTPSLTYTKGFAPELEAEKIPLLSKMLGKKEVVPPSHDYVVPYMGASTSDLTEEIFKAFLDTPFEVLYDIDEARISQAQSYSYGHYGSYYGGNSYNSMYKTFYPNKSKSVAWLMKHIKYLTSLAKKSKTNIPTKKSLTRLSKASLINLIDTVVVNLLYANDNATTRECVQQMNKVFHMFDLDFLEFADNYQKTYDVSTLVVDYFSGHGCPSLYQWSNIKKNKVNFYDVIGADATRLRELAATTTTVTKTSKNWPISDEKILGMCSTLGITGTYVSMRLHQFKEHINTLYSITPTEQRTFWDNLEMLDMDAFDFVDEISISANKYTVEAVQEWSLSSVVTKKLIEGGLTAHDLIWLPEIELGKLLIEKRRDKSLKYTKETDSQTKMADYLTMKHTILTIPIGKINYPLKSVILKERVEEMFNNFYASDLLKVVPQGTDIASAMELLDRLQIIKSSFISHPDVKDLMLSLLCLSEETIVGLEKYVAPYTSDVSLLIEYTEKELSELASEDVGEILTCDDIKERIHETHAIALNILSVFKITKYSTVLGVNIVEVDINSTNSRLALTNLVLETLCLNLSKGNAIKVIDNINLLETDILELLEMPTTVRDVYINKLINFNLDWNTIVSLEDKKLNWKDILSYVSEDLSVYTGTPYSLDDKYYSEEGGITVVISREEYFDLCKKLCVIKSINTNNTTSEATLTSGFKIKLHPESKRVVGDVVYPIMR